MFTRPHARRDRGATALETIGIIVIAALIVTTVAWAAVHNGGEAKIKYALCQAINKITGGTTDCGADPNKNPYEPPKCKVSEVTEKGGGKISIAFIDLGGEFGFVETVYSDGSVSLTATNQGELGASVGLGGKAEAGGEGAGADIDLGGGIKVKDGSTWDFKSKEEADAMRKQIQDYVNHQRNPLGFLNPNPPQAPRPPDVTQRDFKLSADVSGELGLPIVAGLDGEAGAQKGFSIKHSANGEGPEDDTTSYRTDFKYNGELSGELAGKEQSGSLALGGSLEIKVDSQGNIIGITETHILEGSSSIGSKSETDKTGKDGKDRRGKASLGSSTEVTNVTVLTNSLTLDPKSPEYANQLQIVKEYIALQALDSTKISTLDMIDLSNPRPGLSRMRDLMQQNAVVTVQNFTNVEDGAKFAAEIKLGLKLGISVNGSTTTSTSNGVQYLEAPDASGHRTWTDHPHEKC